MRALLQRVRRAEVRVDGLAVGGIGHGLLVFAGIQRHDDETSVTALADRILAYRVFADAEGRMNLGVREVRGGVLLVSQFTLAAETRKGLRPGFSTAAAPERALELYDVLVAHLRGAHADVATGRFGADMQVELVNDGPVTFLLEN